MKRKLKIFLIVIVGILALILLFVSLFTFINNPSCFFSAGIWRTFSDGCGDSCTKARQTPDDIILCTMALEENCDCGPFRCWNHETQRCELN